MVLHFLRRHQPRISRALALLFVVLWSAVVATPCVMAMQADPERPAAHDCPHCPPKPCHDSVSPPDCDDDEPADRLRTVDTSTLAIALPASATAPNPTRLGVGAAPPAAHAPSRDGPRPHLLHVRFDE